MTEEIENLNKSKKRQLKTDSNENTKKAKSFSAKQFRKQLNSNEKTTALQSFFELISNENSKEDCILAYLENGGNINEILKILESDGTVPHTLIFDITNKILLKINIKYPQYRNAATESCTYLLSSFITLINKMLNLSSTSKERVVILKLLATIVTLSASLAKEILLHVNFNPTNLELLTKTSQGKNEIRNAFIFFLTAFLVSDNYPTLVVLLEKRNLLTSIINGLKFDKADTVCLVLTAMKNHILENPLVSKTVKMRIFSTPVVRDIVNLYNWKGPEGFQINKNCTTTIKIDEYDKSKVSESVHNFLLILCTSHKFGVIFKDYLLGLGKKNQNSLMYTVLESLERPWEHSYACELVTKICGACPDLAKTMWANLKSFLEPRLTAKWLNAMKFAAVLLDELQPSCIEFCVRELNVHQLAQIITFLIMPTPILKVLIPENKSNDQQFIKHQVLLLILKMLEKMHNYVNFSQTFLSPENHEKLKEYLNSHINRNLPNANFIIENWDNTTSKNDNDDNNFKYNPLENLDLAFNIFDYYQNLCPQKLTTLNSFAVDVKNFLGKINNFSGNTKFSCVFIKAIKYFLYTDPTLFAPETNLFGNVLSILWNFYYQSPDLSVLKVLNNLFRNTGIFENYPNEINIWIDGMLNLKNYSDIIERFILDSIKLVTADILGCLQKCDNLQLRLSPLIFGVINYFGENQINKNIKTYLNFVVLNLFYLQTDLGGFYQVFANNQIVSNSLFDYMQSWIEKNDNYVVLDKFKGKRTEIQELSVNFNSNNFDNFLQIVSNLQNYPNLKLNLLQACLFYFCNCKKEKLANNCEKYVNFLIENKNLQENDRYFEIILNNSDLLKNVSLLNLNNSDVSNDCFYPTKFIFNVIKQFRVMNYDIDKYLVIYRSKLVAIIRDVFKKPKKYSEYPQSVDILEIIQLNYEDCKNIIFLVTKLKKIHFEANLDLFSYQVFVYCLMRFSKLCKENFGMFDPLAENIIMELCDYFIGLNFEPSALSLSLYEYLRTFPHNISVIPLELFEYLLNLNDFNKNNVSLCCYLLERKTEFLDCFKLNLELICEKKGLLLSLLDIVVSNYKNEEDLIKNIYIKIEPTILKILQKPHKANQHFQNHPKSVGYLIEKFMSNDFCRIFIEKAHKFEVTETFHVFLLGKIFEKFLHPDILDNKIFINITLTFVYLKINLFKQKSMEHSPEKFRESCGIFDNFLGKIDNSCINFDLLSLSKNETFKQFCKLALKYGISGEAVLLRILARLIEILSRNLSEDEAQLILDMLLSHSEILEVIINENCCKFDLLFLFHVLCKNWPNFMIRNHIPVLLAAYNATVAKSDKIILELLKMYESRPNQTKFFDFKPFLWGQAAASRYSIRLNIQSALFRQPKMGDVLDILQDHLINSTINNYPDETLSSFYDLNFFLPLFSHLLSAENTVQTYRFTRKGALSLTIIGLSSDNKETRLASCHVLSRFYYHLEAKHSGKDIILWIRFVKAICMGAALLNNKYRLNNFAAVFLARTAIVLTQPNHVMYVPLTQYLAAKAALNFDTIPELYTFTHSSDLNYKEHRNFILEVIRDGTKTQDDFMIFKRSMAFKMFSELSSSVLCNLETKLLILDVYLSCCQIPFAVKILCDGHSFLVQLYDFLLVNLKIKDKREVFPILTKFIKILFCICKVNKNRHDNFLIILMLTMIAEENYLNSLENEVLDMFYQCLVLIDEKFSDVLEKKCIDLLLIKANDQFCKYFSVYGCNFVREKDLLQSGNANCYLRLLFFNKFQK